MDELDVAIHRVAEGQRRLYAKKIYMETKARDGYARWAWDIIRIPFGG